MSAFLLYNHDLDRAIFAQGGIVAAQLEIVELPLEWIEVDSPPSAWDIRKIAGELTIVPREIAAKSEDNLERERLKAHVILNATPTQIDDWIDNNVTDLASAKEVLKLLAKITILGVRK